MEKRCYYKFHKSVNATKAIGDGRMVAAEEKFYKRIGANNKDSKKVTYNGDRGDTSRYNPLTKYENSKLVFDCSDEEQQAAKQVIKSLKSISRNPCYYRSEASKKSVKKTECKIINENRVPQNTDAASSTGSSNKHGDTSDENKSLEGGRNRKYLIHTCSRNTLAGRLKTVDFADDKHDRITVKIPYWVTASDTETERKTKKELIVLKRKSFESMTSDMSKKNQQIGRLARKKNSKRLLRRQPPPEEEVVDSIPIAQIAPECCTKYTAPLYESWFNLNWTSKPRNDYLNRIINDSNMIKEMRIDDNFTFDELRYEETFTGKIKLNGRCKK